MNTKEMEVLKIRSSRIRRYILDAIFNAQTGHEGPALSMVEILTLLYAKHLTYDVKNPKSLNKDYLIVSKGHGSPGLYATFAEFNLIPIKELMTLRKLGSRLQGHPNSDALPWVDFSTGSLGQGLSVAIGLALGHQLQGNKNRVFCILGDGELQEGQNWEAAMSAPKFGIKNLIAIVDRNKIQSDGFTEEIMPLGDLAAKWRAFGWDAVTVDGHNFSELDAAICRGKTADAPFIIIAETIKGKGVSFMENSAKWHHFPLDEKHYQLAIKEIELNYAV